MGQLDPQAAAALFWQRIERLPQETQTALGMLSGSLRQQSMELFVISQFELAYAAAQEGYALARQTGFRYAAHLLNLAAVEAAWGREEAAANAEEALALARRHGVAFVAFMAEWTLGFIELTAGRTETAADRLSVATNLDRADINPIVSLPAIPDAVEALVRADRAQEAASRLATFKSFAELAPTDGRRALLARSQALTGERPPAHAFEEAVELGRALPPFQRARTQLLCGEWLRRERRRQDARVQLRAALELFRAVGSPPWEERAGAELRATGERTRRRNPSTLDDLTPRNSRSRRWSPTGSRTRRSQASRTWARGRSTTTSAKCSASSGSPRGAS